MRVALLLVGAFVVGCSAQYNPKADAQFVKTGQYTKGGNSGNYYKGDSNISRFFNNTQPGHQQPNQTSPINYEVGVCYIEVPTATLVHDAKHMPAGNGSRPDLSRVRSCCQGYIRNIHNFKICDPVCSKECVNALCTAPETCSCFPDHVKNLAGVCVPTCPIGCQNGYCSGGECLCKEGYQLDLDGKFCVPFCRGNCGGLGNCTAPNTCECNKGYLLSQDGTCKPFCSTTCLNGNCAEKCCQPGFIIEKASGKCIPHCNQNCGPNGCVAPNTCGTTPSSTVSQPGHPENHQSQYPYPNQPNNTHQGPSSYQPNPVPIHGNLSPTQYDNNPHNQYPGPYPSNPQTQTQTGQYPGYYPNQPNQQHLYPNLPNFNNQYPGYPHPNQTHTVNTTGQVYQETQFNPLSNITFNLQGPGQYQPAHNGSQGQPGYGQYAPQGQVVPAVSPYGPQTSTGQGQNLPSQTAYGHTGANGQTDYNQFAVQGQSQGWPDQSAPQCAEACVNGQCVDTNKCECFPGFNPDQHDSTGTRCLPHCPGGCTNGFCSAPNTCVCMVGYYKDFSVKGRSSCVRRIRRSLEEKPVNVADLLEYAIRDY